MLQHSVTAPLRLQREPQERVQSKTRSDRAALSSPATGGTRQPVYWKPTVDNQIPQFVL